MKFFTKEYSFNQEFLKPHLPSFASLCSATPKIDGMKSKSTIQRRIKEYTKRPHKTENEKIHEPKEIKG